MKPCSVPAAQLLSPGNCFELSLIMSTRDSVVVFHVVHDGFFVLE